MDAAEAASIVAKLPLYESSPMWGKVTWLTVGGITEVGFGRDARGDELILCVGWNGRGVFDRNGQLLARDGEGGAHDSPWYDPHGLTAEGIGPLAATRAPIAGLAGGGLALTTSDGWSLCRLTLSWPDQVVVLQPSGSDVLWAGHDAGCTRLPDGAGEMRAAGFSPTGRLLVVATSADMLVLSR